MGGLHGFINWPRGMLTDSGGFQMVGVRLWLCGMVCAAQLVAEMGGLSSTGRAAC